MRLLTGVITAAFGAKVLAADSYDYLGGLTDLYGSYDTDAVNSIANLYKTDGSYFQHYQTLAEELTDKPWYSNLAQLSDAAEASKAMGELWFTSYENWASSVAAAGGHMGLDISDLGASHTDSKSNSKANSGSKTTGGSKSSGSGGSGSKSSGSGSKSSGSGSGSSSSSGSDSSSSSSSGSGAGVYYAPFGATLGALILALI